MKTPSPSPPQQDRSRRSLDRILEATERLLQTRPFDELTVADIAREAGVSTGLLYSRFESKDEILPFLVDRFLRQQLRKFRSDLAPERSKAGLGERLAQLTGRIRGMGDESLGLLRAAAARRLLRPDEIGEEERARSEKIRATGRTWLLASRDEVARDDPEAALEFVNWIVFLVGQLGPMLVRDSDELDAILANLETALLLFLQTPGPTHEARQGASS